MTKIFLLLTIVFVALVAKNRDRIYLRDPIAHVERDGVRTPDARVFINYSNDVLVQAGSEVYLVQAWNRIPGAPVHLTCVQTLACLADADHATSIPVLANGRPGTGVVMTNRSVSFVEGSGTRVGMTLR